VSYLAVGSIKGLRPLRYEKRIARNRFIFLSLFFALILWGLIYAFFNSRSWELEHLCPRARSRARGPSLLQSVVALVWAVSQSFCSASRNANLYPRRRRRCTDSTRILRKSLWREGH
jgi:hypothetical protein